MPTTFRHLVGLPVKDSVPGESLSQSKEVPSAGSVTQIDDPPPEGIPEVRLCYNVSSIYAEQLYVVYIPSGFKNMCLLRQQQSLMCLNAGSA